MRYILEEDRAFKEYVVRYTNAATIVSEDFRDTEDLDGLFSGWDPETRTYDPESWQYEDMQVAAASGQREQGAPTGQAAHGAHGGALEHGEPPHHDETLQHPRCVYQLLRRHFARYTPELVEETCGVSREQFLEVCEALCDNSGRERTSALCYAVGWTQHTVGVQYIRTASIIQLLLGNIGRPGGGIMALRGHASIQGSTDIPTLYDILPGYLPMPAAQAHGSLHDYVEQNSPPAGYWANMGAYTVSLLKAWWGDAATAENDFCFDHLPRLTGDHSYYTSLAGMVDGTVKGLFVMGENPTVGAANGGYNRAALRGLDWLVVRDLVEIETAAFWHDAPEIETGEVAHGRHRHRGLLPARGDPRREEGHLHQHPAPAAVARAGRRAARRLPLGAVVHVPPRAPRAREAGRLERRARPGRARADLGLPDRGRLRRSRRRGGPARDRRRRPDHRQGGARLPAAQGRRLDGVRLLDLRRLLRRRRQPGRAAQAGLAAVVGGARVGLGVADEPAHPLQPRLGRPRGQAVVGAQALPLVGRRAGQVDGRGRARLQGRHGARLPSRPRAPRAPTRCAATSRSPCRPTARRGSTRPPGLVDGPMPTHYEPHESPFGNPLYASQQSNPARQQIRRPENPYNPTHGEPGVDVFPYVATTYRLTEHHTAGGMSRWLPHLAELQPEMFCEVSPALARERGLEHGGWMTVVTLRAAIEARVMVTERMTPLTVGRPPAATRSACPTTGARAASSTGRLGQRPARPRPRPQRPHRRVQGADLRRARRAPAARARRCVALLDDYRRRAGEAGVSEPPEKEERP